jgi:hypothetical protein
MRVLIITISVCLFLFGISSAADPISFKLTEKTFAFDSIKIHKDIWVASLSSSDDNGANLQKLLIKSIREGKIVDILPGTKVTVVGRSNGLVVESTIENKPGIWLIPVKVLKDAGIPSPKMDPYFDEVDDKLTLLEEGFRAGLSGDSQNYKEDDQTNKGKSGGAKGLGISYDQLMVGMKPFFPKMEFNPLPEPSYYGRSDYGGLDYASYSIYGKDKSNSLRVSLYAPLKRPWPKERMMKTAHILSNCLHNAVPEWKNEAERTEWLGSSVESMIHNPSSLNNSTNPDSNKEFARDYGSKRIKLELKIGWVILTVDPRSDD